MSKVKIQGNSSGTGTFTISAPNSNTDRSLTLPDGAGEILLSDGDGSSLTGVVPDNTPCFEAYRSVSNQVMNHNTVTKVNFDGETFDTTSDYDNSSNYRFTPSVAGYYQVNLSLKMLCTTNRTYYLATILVKNGSQIKDSVRSYKMDSGQNEDNGLSALVYMNGSTDYLEGHHYHYDYTSNSTIEIDNSSQGSFFSAYLVRKP